MAYVPTTGPSRGAISGAQITNFGYRGPEHTVDAIQRMIAKDRKSPHARSTVEDVCKQLYGKDYLSEAAAIYYAVCRGMRYMRDPATIELVKDLEVQLKTKNIDCEELSSMLATLLSTSGMTHIEIGTVGFSPGAISHAVLRFRDPRSGRWVVLDPVAGPGTATMLNRVKTAKWYRVL